MMKVGWTIYAQSNAVKTIKYHIVDISLHLSTKKSKVEDEISEKKIYELLNKKINEIREFEQKLKGLLEIGLHG